MGLFSLAGKRIAYMPTPKNASTSIKAMILQTLGVHIDTNLTSVPSYQRCNLDRNYVDTHSPASAYKHHVLQCPKGKPPQDSDLQFCIVRDPVDRFLSAYASRILFHKDLLLPAHQEMGLRYNLCLNPDLDDFIKYFDQYLKIPIVRYHFAPQVESIGDDLGAYTNVYRLNEVKQVQKLLSELAEFEIPTIHVQTAKHTLVLSSQRRLYLEQFYCDDYQLLKGILS